MCKINFLCKKLLIIPFGGNHGNSGLLNIMINPEPTEGRAGKQNSNNALENDSLPKSDLQETRTLRENASQAFENASSLKSEPAEHSTLEVNIGQVLEKDSCLKSEPTEFFCPAVFSNKIITSFFVLPASVSPFTIYMSLSGGITASSLPSATLETAMLSGCCYSSTAASLETTSVFSYGGYRSSSRPTVHHYTTLMSPNWDETAVCGCAIIAGR